MYSISLDSNWAFSDDITSAMLMSQNNKMAAILESQFSPEGVAAFSYIKTFFSFNKFADLLATQVEMLYRQGDNNILAKVNTSKHTFLHVCVTWQEATFYGFMYVTFSCE